MNKQVAYYPTDDVLVWLNEQPKVSPSINTAVRFFIEHQRAEYTLLEVLSEIAASLAAIRVLLEEVRRGKV